MEQQQTQQQSQYPQVVRLEYEFGSFEFRINRDPADILEFPMQYFWGSTCSIDKPATIYGKPQE
jgi:hypothetical protein